MTGTGVLQCTHTATLKQDSNLSHGGVSGVQMKTGMGAVGGGGGGGLDLDNHWRVLWCMLANWRLGGMHSAQGTGC